MYLMGCLIIEKKGFKNNPKNKNGEFNNKYNNQLVFNLIL